MKRDTYVTLMRLGLVAAVFSLVFSQGIGAQNGNGGCNGNSKDAANCPPAKMRSTTKVQRKAARLRAGPQKKGVNKTFAGIDKATAMYSPLATVGTGAITALATMGTAFGTPDYFGIANWANSPLPQLDPLTLALLPNTGMRKFVDMLPNLPLAVPDTTTFPGSDYYEISLEEYYQVMHTDLAGANGGLGTKLRGYRQTNGPAPQLKPVYLGPVIVAQKNRPVRVKFTNTLAAGAGGNLFIPTDTTYMGAGNGPTGAPYTQNRATLHLHGGNTPWISDGTPHQWTVPVGDGAVYQKGVSTAYVPDMWFDGSGNVIASCAGSTTCAVVGASNNPGPGRMTFYWTNQQSGRLMFYHDHAYGITRLNVYAGEAAGYLLYDPKEENALASATVPGTLGTIPDLAHLIPLVIQDKTFVPDDGAAGGQLAAQDPTWPSPANPLGGVGGVSWSKGNLWFPHVYTPNQNPMDLSGANAFGRWDYGPWFWPPQNPNTLVSPPVPCPGNPTLLCPGTPNPSGTPEGFMDTMVVNGAAYPKLTVDPAAYRFQILSAGNDRALNLGLYVAEPLTLGLTNPGSGYLTAPLVTLTPANGAVATAILSYGGVGAITLLGNGLGYTAVPNVIITGDGTGATATATIGGPGGSLTGITVTNPGKGYTFATVAIDPSPLGCTPASNCATATAVIAPAGSLAGITVTTAPTTPFTTAPAVSIAAPTGVGGVQALAIASVNTEVKMLPAVPPAPGAPLQTCAVNTSGGGGMGIPIAAPTITGLPPNCWPSTWPTDGRDGGVPDPTTAGPPLVQIGTEGGLLPAPVVIPSTPTAYEYNRRSITVLNIFTHGLLLGPAERADVVVDFSAFAGKTLILYNDAPAPVPAFDSRTDYYTGDPDQTTTGGAASTLPGYGPNTRTIMQIQVAATATVPGSHALTLSTLQGALPGIYSGVAFGGAAGSNQPNPIIPPGIYARISDTSITTAASPVTGLTLTAGGSGYLAAPGVFILGGGGSGATATATLAPRPVGSLTVTAGCGPAVPCTAAQLYSSVPAVSFTLTSPGGAGAAATAVLAVTGGVKSIAVTNGGKNYTTASVSITGGGGSGAAATATVLNGAVTAISVTNPGSGYSTTPTVTITGNGTGAKASATLGRAVANLILTNGGSGYNSAPTVNVTGGGGSGATATSALAPGPVASLTLTAGGSGYTTAPLVTIAGGGGTGALGTASVGNSMPMLPKAIQELFTLDYGRMNATLGVEIPFTSFLTQTTIPYGYVDPPTELFKDGDTQVWKITHNGVDTHFMHFHLFNVQVINRVGWDGAIKPPDPNELGWKDTVRMNPLEDIIVALNPMKQTKIVPTDLDVSNLPNSIRPLDVTEPLGYISAMSFTNIDPYNHPVTVVNDLTNFGWEYVWHCHILGHEENDMMRAMIMAVAPVAPSNLNGTVAGTLTWTDNSLNETGFTIQTGPAATGPWTTIATVPSAPGSGTTVTYKNGQLIKGGAYYQVIANNLVGYTRQFAAPAVGYPSMSIDSLPSNVVLH